jgi:tRNA (5-methylaminomethyl-2-thiouridylate)-methyltransferase
MKAFRRLASTQALHSGKRRRVAVGISGGVDSSVVAYLFKKNGWDVQGVFMKNWDSNDEMGQEACTYDDDLKSAEEVCSFLKIPLTKVDFVSEYWENVFAPFLNAYRKRLTPNPDVLCNRFIKFGFFREFAFNKLGCDVLATGHYAQLFPSISLDPAVDLPLAHTDPLLHRSLKLLSAHDPVKDQSDFLSQVSPDGFHRVAFPLGQMWKHEVKDLAKENGIPSVLSRKESYGICFIGKRNMREFLGEYLEFTPGRFIDLETGAVLGEHASAEYFTCGQGAKIPSLTRKYYVVARAGSLPCMWNQLGVDAGNRVRRVDSNSSVIPVTMQDSGDVFVVPTNSHPSLLVTSFAVSMKSFCWISPLFNPSTIQGNALPCFPIKYRIRHPQSQFGNAVATVMTKRDYFLNCVSEIVEGKQRVHLDENDTRIQDLFDQFFKQSTSDPSMDDHVLVIRIPFTSPASAVAAGQSLSLYSYKKPIPGESTWRDSSRECYGGGPIEFIGPSLYDLAISSSSTGTCGSSPAASL